MSQGKKLRYHVKDLVTRNTHREKKKEIWPNPMTKPPIPTEMMCNMKALSLLVWKLWPRLKFLFTHKRRRRRRRYGYDISSQDICHGSLKRTKKCLKTSNIKSFLTFSNETLWAGHRFSLYMYIHTLTLKIWPWIKVMTHSLVICAVCPITPRR